MSAIWQMVRGGHWPTLLGAWLHLTVSFMVWLLIGALSLPMARALGLSGTDLSVLVALPPVVTMLLSRKMNESGERPPDSAATSPTKWWKRWQAPNQIPPPQAGEVASVASPRG